MNGDDVVVGVSEVVGVGPCGEGGPVANGVGDDAGLVGGDVISEEMEW